MDADLERRGGRRRGPALRQGPPGRRSLLARQGDAQDGARGTVRGRRGAAGARPRRLALRGPFDDLPAVRETFDARPATSTGSWPGTRSARTRGPASSTSRRAAGPRTSSSARRSACRSSRPSTKSGIFLEGFGPLSRSRRPRRRGPDRRAPEATRTASTAWSRTTTATRTAGDAARRSSSAWSTSGTSAWVRSTTSRATS